MIITVHKNSFTSPTHCLINSYRYNLVVSCSLPLANKYLADQPTYSHIQVSRFVL